MPTTFSLADLCDLAEVTPRTVRFYIAQGLLRPPSGAGPAARYDDGHLHRLRLIRRLQKDHLPLAEIRRRLDALSDSDAERIATEPPAAVDSAADYIARVLGTKGLQVPTSAPRAPASVSDSSTPPFPDPSATLPVRSQWERVALHADLELHIRRPLDRDLAKRVDRLLDAARTILKEEQR